MIFVTVGTHHQPFDRLLSALDSLDPELLIVQYGPSPPPVGVVRAEPYLPFDRMLECYREAEKVITHAGVGSILCASREGHLPIVVPRRHDLGEHVDEHQAELARALETRGSVVPVWDVADLAEQVAAAPPRGPAERSADSQICETVHAALVELAPPQATICA